MGVWQLWSPEMNGFTIIVSIVKIQVSPERCRAFGIALPKRSFECPGRSISRISQSPGGNYTSRRNLIITDWEIKSNSNHEQLEQASHSSRFNYSLDPEQILATGKGFLFSKI
jgi:hypothetical protein